MTDMCKFDVKSPWFAVLHSIGTIRVWHAAVRGHSHTNPWLHAPQRPAFHVGDI